MYFALASLSVVIGSKVHNLFYRYFIISRRVVSHRQNTMLRRPQYLDFCEMFHQMQLLNQEIHNIFCILPRKASSACHSATCDWTFYRLQQHSQRKHIHQCLSYFNWSCNHYFCNTKNYIRSREIRRHGNKENDLPVFLQWTGCWVQLSEKQFHCIFDIEILRSHSWLPSLDM